VKASPVMFIQNVGQFADGARFQVRGGDRTIWLAEDALCDGGGDPSPALPDIGEGVSPRSSVRSGEG